MTASSRIAVTGSNGQLGMEITRIASQYPEFQFSFLTRVEFPLDDQDKMVSWIRQHPVDILINCAAYTAVDKAESEKEKAWQINALAPGIIATELSKAKSKMIQVSTDYVFDGNSTVPLSEEAITNPVNYYGTSKLEGEKQVLNNNPDSQIIRTSWVYSEFGNNFVKTMLRLMKDRESIRVVQDQVGSPTYAGDLAKAILDILRSEHFVPGIFHYSNEGETNWHAFATEIKKLSRSACAVVPIPSSEYPTPAKRPFYSLMDKSKIKKEYGLLIPDWQSSLVSCMELIKKQGV